MGLQEQFAAILSWRVRKEGRGFQAKLSRDSGVSASYINDIMKGRKSCPEEVRRNIAEALGYSYENMLMMGQAILDDKDPEAIPVKGYMGGELRSPTAGMKQLPQVPLISWVQAGEWSEAIDEFHPGDAEEWIYSAKNVGPNAFALRIVGDSMEPEFREGEVIIVDPGLEAVSGKFVVAKNGDHEVTFKQLLFDGSDVYLSPLNDRYPVKNITGQNIRIIGVVTQKVKEY